VVPTVVVARLDSLRDGDDLAEQRPSVLGRAKQPDSLEPELRVVLEKQCLGTCWRSVSRRCLRGRPKGGGNSCQRGGRVEKRAAVHGGLPVEARRRGRCIHSMSLAWSQTVQREVCSSGYVHGRCHWRSAKFRRQSCRAAGIEIKLKRKRWDRIFDREHYYE